MYFTYPYAVFQPLFCWYKWYTCKTRIKHCHSYLWKPWVLVKFPRIKTLVADRGCPVNWGEWNLVIYTYTESLTVNRSRYHVWRVPYSLNIQDLFCRFRKRVNMLKPLQKNVHPYPTLYFSSCSNCLDQYIFSIFI